MDMAPDCSQLQNIAKGSLQGICSTLEGASHLHLASSIRQRNDNNVYRYTPPTILRENGRECVVKFCESTPHRRKGGSRDEERKGCARGGNLPYQ
ncbi:hypothetical protein CR513_44773, partial [Mucuna pruriens]